MRLNVLTIVFSILLAAGVRAQEAEAPVAESAEVSPIDAKMAEAMRLYAMGPEHGNETIILAEEILAAEPDHLEATLMLGLTYYGLGRHAEAINPLTKVIQLDESQSARLVPILVECYIHDKQFAVAEQLLDENREMLVATPRGAASVDKLTRVFLIQRRTVDIEKAVAVLEQEDFDPKNDYAYLTIDPENVEEMRKDRYFRAFLRNPAGNWRTVLAMPSGETFDPVWAVWLVDGKPQAWMTMQQHQDEKKRHLQFNPAVVAHFIKPVSNWQMQAEPVRRQWNVSDVPLEGGGQAMAFQVAKRTEAQPADEK